MNKLKTFWYSFKKSITTPSYYRDIVKVPFSFSLQYLVVLIFATIFFQTAILAIQAATYLPQLPATVATIKSSIKTLYPSSLVITVKDGILSTNKEEPFFIDMPEDQQIEEFEHLVTFDTKARADQFYDYKTVFLITDKNVIYPDSAMEGNYEVSDVSAPDKSYTITHNDYKEFTAAVDPLSNWFISWAPLLLVLGVIVIPLFGTAITLVWNFIAIAVLSLISWMIANIFKVTLGYKKIYQLGMHAVTLPMVLTLILSLLGWTSPLLFTAAFLLWIVYILSKYNEVKA